jgi:hypothetical protein
MTTARDLITMSLRSIGVLHSGETPSAEEANDGLVTLNQMLNSWLYEGIDLEFIPLTLNDTVPYPDDHIGPFRWNLALRLSPDYGIAVTPAVAAMAKEGYDQLRREYLDNRELEGDPALSAAYSPNRGYDL